MSLLHTVLSLDKTELLGTELETNTILKSHSQCEDYATEQPLKVAELNLHDKGIAPIEGKDVCSAWKKAIQLLVLAAKRANLTYSPSKICIHDRISEDLDKTDIMSEIKTQSFHSVLLPQLTACIQKFIKPDYFNCMPGCKNQH